MGHPLHLDDLKNRGIGKKMVISNKHDGGFEAPRNSFELPMETLQRDNANILTVPYGYRVQNSWPEIYSDEPLPIMKRLIREEVLSKRQTIKHNAPSVVARLMGFTTLPNTTKPISHQLGRKKELHIVSNFPKVEPSRTRKARVSFPLNSFTRKKIDSFDHKRTRTSKRTSLKPREHPQEEELQKFKKEFVAWQRERFKEYSNVVELDSTPSQWWLAQEDLNKKKMALYANNTEVSSKVKAPPRRRARVHHHEIKKIESLAVTKTPNPDFQQYSRASSDNISDIFYAPSRIVVMRPSPSTIGYNEDSWINSPGIEDFLEEVKERLKHELKGKPSKRSIIARGGGIETPYNEKPSNAKQITQSLVKQVSFPRSTSFKSETNSPKFTNEDTRRFLAERLSNVLKEGKHENSPSWSSIDGSVNKARHWDFLRNESHMQSQSFREDPNDNVMYQEELSPRNFIRSFSAPESGTFGELLLEDQHILEGAHIRRKHEFIENPNKEKLNFRQRISSFKYSLRLLGKKIKSIGNKDDIIEDVPSEPTIFLENSIEVPPRPMSICSSDHEDYSSQTSISDVYSVEDSVMPQVFKQIGSNLNELRRKLNQLEAEGSEVTTIDDEQENEVELEMPHIEDEVELYIRDLLVCSGLYDGSYDTSLSRWDPLGKPISTQVFEELQESCRQRSNDDLKNQDDEGSSKSEDDEWSIKNQGDELNHKILFDLVNEVLSNVLGTPTPLSKLMKMVTSNVPRPLRGNKLLDHVWEIIYVLLYPPEDMFYYEIDHMVSRDIQCTPWSNSSDDDDINTLGKEIEFQIIGDLIEEIVKDMQY